MENDIPIAYGMQFYLKARPTRVSHSQLIIHLHFNRCRPASEHKEGEVVVPWHIILEELQPHRPRVYTSSSSSAFRLSEDSWPGPFQLIVPMVQSNQRSRRRTRSRHPCHIILGAPQRLRVFSSRRPRHFVSATTVGRFPFIVPMVVRVEVSYESESHR